MNKSKTKIDLSSLTILSQEMDESNHVVYVCKCKDLACSNTIRVRKNNRHDGFCRKCADKQKRKRPYETLYNIFITSATRNKIPIFLTYEDFFQLCQVKECHYCQSPTIRSEHKFNSKTFSRAYMIDRKDNSIPYIASNCVSCCWACNDLKSDRFTYEQFLQISALTKTFKTQ